jgi:protein-L-isoaspartate(D-aspartate) O-methyltransferase
MAKFSQNDEHLISRRRMVERLYEQGIRDERILQAMVRVPRQYFVPEALQFQAYKDNALPIGANQTISQPYIVAKMTELLELEPTHKVLEIGAGSGYQTVILSLLVRAVYAIERIPELTEEAKQRLRQLGVRNVNLKCADGTLGWPSFSPYDAILVAAGGPELPTPLIEQLKNGGKMVVPVGATPESQTLIRVTKKENGFTTEECGGCVFVPLIGEHGWH